MGVLDTVRNSIGNQKEEFVPARYWLNFELNYVDDQGEEQTVKASRGIPIDDLKGLFYEALKLKGEKMPDNSEEVLSNVRVTLKKVESDENKKAKAEELLKFFS